MEVRIPLLGAVHLYQTEFSPAGSPTSVVEPLFVPTSEPLVVEITIALAKSSFGGGTSSDQTNVKADVRVFLVRRNQ